MKRKSVVVLVVLLSLATLGLAQDRDQPSAKSQERITREVRHELLMLPYFGVFDYLAYKVDGSTVMLLGQVVRPSLKSDAENAVKRIEGVEKVITRSRFFPHRPWTTVCGSGYIAKSMAIRHWRSMLSECRSRSALS